MGELGKKIKGLPDGGMFFAEGYMVWEKTLDRKLPRKEMLSRPALEKWLYAHFLKICLPYPREKFSDAPVHAPLNLTAFLRLVGHLSTLGYPSHWLSGVLSALCGDGSRGGEITTTARPPRSAVTTAADVDAVFPPLKMTVAPWTAEFTTLLSIWSRLMPFGFTAAPSALVAPGDISEYTVRFPEFHELQMRIPHFELVFRNLALVNAFSVLDFRRLLLDDEKGDTSDAAKKKKREGFHIVSAFKYVTDTRTASFWCRADVIRQMMDGDWRVSIWRTDTWEGVTRDVSVKVVKLIRTWEQ